MSCIPEIVTNNKDTTYTARANSIDGAKTTRGTRNMVRQRKVLYSRNSACIQPLRLLMEEQTHRVLAAWALDCAARPLAFFEERIPAELRPREAIELSRMWARGAIKMPLARRIILQAHAAAGEAGEHDPRSRRRLQERSGTHAHAYTRKRTRLGSCSTGSPRLYGNPRRRRGNNASARNCSGSQKGSCIGATTSTHGTRRGLPFCCAMRRTKRSFCTKRTGKTQARRKAGCAVSDRKINFGFWTKGDTAVLPAPARRRKPRSSR